jgi:hypothetical protein
MPGALIFETPFGFSVDLSFWQDIFALPIYQLIFVLFVIFGWIIVYLVLFNLMVEKWVEYKVEKHVHQWKWVVLAVDIPPLFIQTPKAVEQIFAQLTGALTPVSITEKFLEGREQKTFSFEIISIEGYIQFLIRTEEEFRDLVEAAVYAQYAEAEITEVEDYVGNIPSHFPDKEYDAYGVEFKLAEAEGYPIRTYPSFEYNISKDQVFSDPMAAILETFSRISRGENFWMQLIIEPITNAWKEEGIELVKEIIAGKKEHHEPFFFKILSVPLTLFGEFVSAFTSSGEEEHGGDKHKEEPEKKVSDLTPGGKITIEAIEEKISKIGFESKLRVIYAAKKEVYNPKRCVNGLIGAMNQFSIVSRNAIVPDSAKSVNNKFVEAFKHREIRVGAKPYVLNIEELATVWHFPLPFVKTPLVQKAGAKRAEPPLGLPVEWAETPLKRRGQDAVSSVPPSEPKSKPPDELMFG